MSGWVFEHGYVADGVEVVVATFPAYPGTPRLGFYEKRAESPRELAERGITECFARIRPATEAEVAS